MIVLLQLLSVTVPAGFALMSFCLVVGPFFAAILRGMSFRINPWWTLLLGVSLAVTLALPVAYGWVAL